MAHPGLTRSCRLQCVLSVQVCVRQLVLLRCPFLFPWCVLTQGGSRWPPHTQGCLHLQTRYTDAVGGNGDTQTNTFTKHTNIHTHTHKHTHSSINQY